MTGDWTEVAEAQAAVSAAYSAMQEVRSNDKRKLRELKQAEEAWHAAIGRRAEALRRHWDPELDGYRLDDRHVASLGRTLQRFYTETVVSTRKGKR